MEQIEERIKNLTLLSNKYDKMSDAEKIINVNMYNSIKQEKEDIQKWLTEFKNKLADEKKFDELDSYSDLQFKEAMDYISGIKNNNDLDELSLCDLTNLYDNFYKNKMIIEKFIENKKMEVSYLD